MYFLEEHLTIRGTCIGSWAPEQPGMPSWPPCAFKGPAQACPDWRGSHAHLSLSHQVPPEVSFLRNIPGHTRVGQAPCLLLRALQL